ncbi:hypothetical protein M426DRAFT_73131 [Hypoxylon sp. CI-4A]|nr:hypothetical protein M426DRAFT_73131 [Hypoxylon sp. CI-4A]
MSIHCIESIFSSCEDRANFSIPWNNSRIVVDLDPSPISNTTEDSFIKKHNAAGDYGDDEEEEIISDRILDTVVQTGRSLFDQFAPPPAPDASTPLPEGIFISFPHEPNQDLVLPKFSTRDIYVLEKLLGDGYIARVSAGGREMCCKVGDEHAAALRVPRLLGLIEAAGDGRIIGLLQEYVPYSDTWELSTLRSIESVSSLAKARREKWASQIKETVQLLHQIGVTWGDGKAANVLVNRDTDDVWTVDFGGGWTDGWVSRELSGTVEGDFMTVSEILEFLRIW